MNVFSNGINYADGETPTVMTSSIESICYEGWYYKNSGSKKKITWYVPLGNTPLLVSDLNMIYASLRILNTVSLPFITVYTAPIGFNDAGKWYHSKTVFAVPDTVSLNENANYCFYAEFGSAVSEVTIDGHTNIKLTVDASNSRGNYTDTNVVKYVAFCTAEDVSAGEVEFILSDINLSKRAGDDIELFLSNNDLFSSQNVNVDSLVLSPIDNRMPGNTPNSAFLNPLSVTKVIKSAGKLEIGHNGLINDTILDNFKLPRLANVAGKGDSSVAVDNTNTMFNNFFLTYDFSVTTNVPGAQFTVEAWGLDCATRTKIYVDENGDIKIMYRGTDLVSNDNVLPGDIIMDASSNPTKYGWSTRVYPGALIPGNWYRLIQTIHFSEDLYGDKVHTRLYEINEDSGNVIDIVLWDVLDNTWEAFYVNHPSQAVNGNMPPSVDSVQIHCCDAPRNIDVATIKNITYSTSKTIQVESIDDLTASHKGIITFLAGNSTGRSTTAMTGLQYLFEASGGYQIERGFDKIAFRTQDLIQRYDVTNSVQVKLDAGLFNTKLGLIKDASNLNIVSTEFNVVDDVFPTDSITITPSDFIDNLKASNIISVGKYSTMYSDFKSYVQKYFGYVGGFSSLFKDASEFDISGGIFNADSFMALVSSGRKVDAADINAVNAGPSMYYPLSLDASNGYTYDSVAKDYVGNPTTYGKTINTVKKWGANALLCVNGGGNDGTKTTRYIVPGVNGMTFSFWVNIIDNPGSNHNMFSLGGVFNMAVRNSLIIYPYINCTNGSYASNLNLYNGFNVGTWNYISLTVDPSGVWKYYLNGVLKQTIGNITSVYAFGYPSTTTALQLQIGAANGYYNEFLYYDRILTDAEITSLYAMYTVNNGATISSWVKFSSLDTTPRTVWSFYDTVTKNTLSLAATSTKYTLGLTGNTIAILNADLIPANANTYTISTLKYPNFNINGTYNFSASWTEGYAPSLGFYGGTWRTPWSVVTGYTQVPYSGGNYIGGGTGKFFTTVIDGLTVSGEWWQMQLPSEMSITKYGMNPFGMTTAYPRGWYLAGSNDGTTWTQIDRQANINSYIFTYNSVVWYDVPNPSGSYKYLRMVITNTQTTNNHSWIQNFNVGVLVPATITTDINAVPALNTWTHIASVIDNGQQNNTWTTYINNVPYASVKDVNNSDLPYINLTKTVNAIGMDASSGLNKMHGYVDDVVIYKAVLSAAKINNLYNSSDTLSKVADYTFDTNSLTDYSVANYASGSAVYDASITHLSRMTASGEIIGSGCLYFPTKTYQGAVTLGKMAFPDQMSMSFSTWAKFLALDNSGSVSTVLSMYSANSSILLSATASKYTLAIRNRKAPVFTVAYPIQNNDPTGTTMTVTGLGYPYCRNGQYEFLTNAFSAGNNSLGVFSATGMAINTTSNLYSTSNGSYLGTKNTRLGDIVPFNNPYGTNVLSTGNVTFSQSDVPLTQVEFTNGLKITADGKRIVYATNPGRIYYKTYDDTTNTWSAAKQTLDTTARQYTGLAITADGSRGVASSAYAYLYLFTWNGTNYSQCVQTLNTTVTDLWAVSLTADGSRLFSSRYFKTDQIYWADWNGTNYGTLNKTLDISRNYSAVCVSSDGSRIAYTRTDSTTVYWANWNGTNYEVGTAIPNATSMGSNGRLCALSSDKNLLFVNVINSNNGSNYFYTTFNSSTGNYNNFTPITTIPLLGSASNSFSFAYREISSDVFELYAHAPPGNSPVYRVFGYRGGYGLSGEFVQIKMPYKLNPTNYIMNYGYAANYSKTFYLLGSNDGGSWDILVYQTNLSPTDNGLLSGRNLVYTINSTKYYNYFRTVVAQTNNTGAAMLQYGKLSGYAQESINYTMNCDVAPSIDSWNHIAGTLSTNGVNSTVKLYINNTPYTFTTDASNIQFPGFGIDTSYNNIAVGMDASGASNKMVGYIDDTKVYNSTLSDAQISSLYNNQTVVETALAKYNFNTETVVSGKIANYASGSPVYDATITNASLVSSTGQRSGSGALFFPSTSYSGAVRMGNLSYDTNTISILRNGAIFNYKFDVSQNAAGYILDTATGNYNMSNNYVNTLNSISSEKSAIKDKKSLKVNAGTTAVYYGGNPIYTIPPESAMTFAFWIYIDSNVANNGKGVLGMSNAAGTNLISIKISGTTTYNLSLQTIFNGINTINIPSATITPATWTYVCWTISTTGVWKFYVNGALQQTIAANVKPFFAATNLFAGSAYGAAGFYGYFDEYRYYERELSAAEITSQYNFYSLGGKALANDLSGSITISNINRLLRNAVDANVFGNRTPNVSTGGAADPDVRSNYGVGDGFLDGDIIWVPAGTTIKLSVGIDSEFFLPINNVGPGLSSNFAATEDAGFGSGDFSQVSSSTTTKISRTLKAPLMIRISNL